MNENLPSNYSVEAIKKQMKHFAILFLFIFQHRKGKIEVS